MVLLLLIIALNNVVIYVEIEGNNVLDQLLNNKLFVAFLRYLFSTAGIISCNNEALNGFWYRFSTNFMIL